MGKPAVKLSTQYLNLEGQTVARESDCCPQIIQISFGRDLVHARTGAVSQTFAYAHAYEKTGVTGNRRTDTLLFEFERHNIDFK